MKKIMLIHGPNLNQLGQRDPAHYGTLTLKEIEQLTQQAAHSYGIEIISYQSNHEGELIDKIQKETPHCMGIIINPGALTHYSYSLHDALLDTNLPAIEVHLSSISEREDWRKISVTAPACIVIIEGKKAAGYTEAVHRLAEACHQKPHKSVHFTPSSYFALNLVIGNPLEHTQSPLLHNTLYKKLKLNARLKALPYSSVEPLIHFIKTLSIQLTAVTMPFKEQILDHLDEVSPEVKLLGAANTIIQRHDRLYGYNTDVDGILYALQNKPVTQKNVLIIGAGGAAKAAGYVMQKQGAQIFWLNRTLEKMDQMVRLFPGEVIHSVEALKEIPLDILIHTTPQGMYPHIHHSPLPRYLFQPHQTVFDMVYNPVETQLLKEAKANGAHTLSGIDMFIGQGIRQVELWTGNTLFNEELVNELRALLIAREEEQI